MKHYLYIHEENYLDGDLKSEAFASTQGSIRLQRTTQTHNYNNCFDLSGSSYFEMTQKGFYYQENVLFTF